MRCYGWKLKVDIFRTEIRKTCLRMNVISHWNIILRGTVDILSLDILESVILAHTLVHLEVVMNLLQESAWWIGKIIGR